MLIRWEIENYLFSKDVLVSFCKKNELPFDEAQYDKIITDIENQNVKELNNHIRNICGIKTNINPEVFKLKLSESFPTDSVTYKELERLIFSHKAT